MMSPSWSSPFPLEEMVQLDLVERRGRRVRRDMAANPIFDPVGLDHHRQRIPPHEALDPALDLAAARELRLLGGPDRVDVGGVGRESESDAAAPRVLRELAE